MAYTMKTALADKSNYGNKRAVNTIKYIVIHYTANDGDHDESNAKYFQTAGRNASAHYFVDDDSVTQSVTDDYVAWSVGGSKYSDCAKTGGGKLYGKVTNANSISIELCDTQKNGTIKATSTTIANAVELTKSLMKKYNIPQANVVRHFDVNGKHCPAYWMTDSAWKSEFWNKLATATTSTTTSTASTSVSYFKACDAKYTSIVDALKSVGCSDTSLTYRQKLAKANNISYTSSYDMNTKLLTLLKAGKLKRA